MSIAYRIVVFLPEPPLEWKIPVAAIIKNGAPVNLGVMEAPCLPTAASLGGRPKAALLRLGLEALQRAEKLRFDSLPTELGPHFALLPVRKIEQQLPDPFGWVVDTQLPKFPQVEQDAGFHDEAEHGPLPDGWYVEGWGRVEGKLRLNVSDSRETWTSLFHGLRPEFQERARQDMEKRRYGWSLHSSSGFLSGHAPTLQEACSQALHAAQDTEPDKPGPTEIH